MIKLEKIVMLQELKREGLSISAIARRTGLDRKTVRKLLDRGLTAPAYSPLEPRPRLLEPYEGYLADKIGNCPDLSGRRLFREIRERGYEGGYTAVTAHLRAIRPDAAPCRGHAGQAFGKPKRAKMPNANGATVMPPASADRPDAAPEEDPCSGSGLPPSSSRGSPRTKPGQAADSCGRPEKSERRQSAA